MSFSSSSKERTTFLCIDSRFRDTSLYPNVSDFVYRLDAPIKNVKRLSLVSSNLPSQNNILNEGYLLLYSDIPETNSVLTGNGDYCFSVLQLKNATTSDFITTEYGCQNGIISNLSNPIAKFHKIRLTLKDPTGNTVDFGEPGGSTDKAFQVQYVLKIIHCEQRLSEY